MRCEKPNAGAAEPEYQRTDKEKAAVKKHRDRVARTFAMQVEALKRYREHGTGSGPTRASVQSNNYPRGIAQIPETAFMGYSPTSVTIESPSLCSNRVFL